MNKLNYNTNEYPFRDIICNILNTNSLSKIHKNNDFKDYELFSREKDQSTKYHKLYYNNFNNQMQSTYIEFIKNIIRPLYTAPKAYQKIPTYRLHFPGNIAVL